MRFDAYTATISGQPFNEVVEAVSKSMGCMVSKGRPMRRFSTVANLDDGPHMAAWIGFIQHTGQVYIEGKGDTSPQLAQAIRDNFPVHGVPRADVCEDVDEEGAFERLQAVIRASKGPKVKAGYVALPDDVQDGRTWSAGVRGGVSYLRLYEAGKHPDRLVFNRPNWVRPELEVRPQYSRDKLAASTMQPMDFWGMSAWSQKVGEAITGLSINRFAPEVRKFSQDKTLRYVSLTFRRMWEEMHANGEDIGRSILQCIQDEQDFINDHTYEKK
jgi:hypothetical protein